MKSINVFNGKMSKEVLYLEFSFIASMHFSLGNPISIKVAILYSLVDMDKDSVLFFRKANKAIFLIKVATLDSRKRSLSNVFLINVCLEYSLRNVFDQTQAFTFIISYSVIR